MASQQWLFRHSSPIRCGGITRVVIAEPHGHQVMPPAAASQPATVPTILRSFTSSCTEGANQNRDDLQSPEEFAGANPSESSVTPMNSSTGIREQTTRADPPRLTVRDN
ncbi:hypothetical protein PISMIDRAFT_8550 [Pisolithus microcarpus 441]|uniref:Uncharacterized protein n=1 Tax=Pisolithus microcarpus 441 TaxID=765257 RepID=A0A0D0A4U6_9AGAM|nr:hypothetical protein PISMIDRAFT_8550 [Pisolithus microcarpus 441]